MERRMWCYQGYRVSRTYPGLHSFRGMFLLRTFEVEISSSLLLRALHSQRRAYQPYGLEGGGPGERGRNIWIKQPRKEDGDLTKPSSDTDSKPKPTPRTINIGGKASVMMGKGDHLIINTPGGGAWGAPKKQEDKDEFEHKYHVPPPTWSARGSLAEREAVQAGF